MKNEKYTKRRINLKLPKSVQCMHDKMSRKQQITSFIYQTVNHWLNYYKIPHQHY